MKLITELYDQDLSLLTEGEGAQKALYITGPFAQAEVVNRNRRNYPKEAMEKAVSKYINEYVSKNRALGELNHPQRMTVDPERACHLITELKWEGNNVIGKAKVLNTPMGGVLRGLVESGVNIGVSTRGAGTVTMREGVSHVGNDFTLATIDAVCDPSGPDCFVNGLMEGVEWICESGVWRSQQIEEAQAVVKKASKAELAATQIAIFERFVGKLQAIK